MTPSVKSNPPAGVDEHHQVRTRFLRLTSEKALVLLERADLCRQRWTKDQAQELMALAESQARIELAREQK